MLRESFLNQVRDKLNLPPRLVSEDFLIKSSEQGNGVRLEINYECGNGQAFVANIPNKRDKGGEYQNPDFMIQISCDPGEVSRSELTSVMGKIALLSRIETWVEHLAEDLSAAPHYRELELNAQRISELEKALGEIPDALPNQDQIETLNAWMQDVEVELRSRIDALEVGKEEKEERIKRLEEQFEDLRDRVASTSLRGFLRALGSRIVRTSTDPKVTTLLSNIEKVAGLLSEKS